MNPSQPSAPAIAGKNPSDRSSSINVGQWERLASLAVGGAIVACGVRRGSMSGGTLALIGSGLIYRGLSGHCHAYEALGIDTAEPPQDSSAVIPAEHGYKVEETLTINRSPAEVYAIWRNLENLPKIMEHLVSVEEYEGQRSRWVARGPMGIEVQWDAEIFNQRENELIAWRSLPDSEIATAGSVHFKSVYDGHSTRLTVSLKYDPPGGKLGANIASIMGEGLEAQLQKDLHRFQQSMEAASSNRTSDRSAQSQ